MSLIRLCQTRETLPQEIEHYFNAHQWSEHKWTWNKTGLYAIPTPDKLFTGARILKTQFQSGKQAVYWLKHRRSTLFPLKRYKQFEDRDHKLKLYPCDYLIKAIEDNDQIEFLIRPIKARTRDRMRKWAQSASFHPKAFWDNFESRKWHKRAFRNFIGRIWRSLRQKVPSTQHDPKQSTQHDREGPIEAILDKLSRPLFLVEIRANRPFHNYSQCFNLPHLGEIIWSKKKHELVLSSEELATLLSPPSPSFMKKISSEACAWLPGDTYIPQKDRMKHLHIVGKTGMGKSSAILEIFKKDLNSFPQIMIIDPHGDLIEKARLLVPSTHKIIVLDPSEREYPLALNPLEYKNEDSLENISSGLLEMFFALSKGSWGPRLEYLLRNTLLTLLQCKNTTLLDIPLLLTQKHHCHNWALEAKDPELQRFWQEEFLNLDIRQRQEMIAPILNKVGPLFSTPLLRNIFGQAHAKFNFDEILKEPVVILVPLSKSKLGEDASRLLGMTLISLLHSTLLRRNTATPLALTIDEFQNYATPTLMTMLSESRKFGLALSLAHQYLKQVPSPIMDAILGNVGSHMVFRSAFEDAELLSQLLQVKADDVMNLPVLNAYMKILKNGETTSTFRHQVTLLKPLKQRAKIQMRFGRPRRLVEAKLKERYTKRRLSPRT